MGKTVTLAARLDSSAAPGLIDDLNGAKGEDLVLDASQVVQIGGLCLEVLMSAAATWKGAGQSVSFASVSEKMTQDLDQIGLTTDMLLETAA